MGMYDITAQVGHFDWVLSNNNFVIGTLFFVFGIGILLCLYQMIKLTKRIKFLEAKE